MSPPSQSRASLPTALAPYASLLHHAAGWEHSVTSALGVWLLLAFSSDTVDERDRPGLAALLGMPLDDAKGLAAELLDNPHPQVRSATAAWIRASHETSGLRSWLATLPGSVERGPIPTQAEADRWAADHTEDLMESFPLRLTSASLLVLASALATKVSWHNPFDVASVDETPKGSASWPANITTVLRSPEGDRRYISSAEHSGAGDVAVHLAYADGLTVVSVAAHPDISQARVMGAAHQLANEAVALPTSRSAGEKSLFDLPLGKHPCWDLIEREGQVSSNTGREEIVEAYLPAWQAASDLDLLADPELGIAAVLGGLNRLLLPDPRGTNFEARQSAIASFNRTGFTAAAVTAFGIRGRGMFHQPSEGIIRTATLHFGGPHAVVAVATETPKFRDGKQQPSGPWHGIPVFSAWVTQAVDAS